MAHTNRTDYTVVFWISTPAGHIAIHALDEFETEEEAKTALHALKATDHWVNGAIIARSYNMLSISDIMDPDPDPDNTH